MNSNVRTMNQGDAILFINEKFYVTYAVLADDLSEIAGAQVIDTSVVNRIAHQHRKGSALLADKADEVFARFIAKPLSKMSPEELDDTLYHAKEWVSSNGLKFRGMNTADCKEWIRRMLRCSLMNWNTCYAPEARKTSKKSALKLLVQKLSRASIEGLEQTVADFVAANSELIAAAGIYA